ncbi:MAG: hypothetical protein PHP70_06640 [Gallionella sp.]|nr:hypothetical protein [Gallionella sp.]
MSWKDESLLSWVTRQAPLWANSQILHWNDVFPRDDDFGVREFVIEERRSSNSTIDMRSVVGQWDHYAGQTWAEALFDPKWKPSKIRHCLNKADENPEYYFNGEVQDDISFNSVDGISWYSVNSGNHRTIIAKFLCEMYYEKTGHYPLVAGVSTTHYVVDWELYNFFKQLRKLQDHGIHVSFVRRSIRRSELYFSVGDYRFNRDGKYGQLKPNQFKAYARWVIQNDGALTRWDKFHHLKQVVFGDSRKLIYPNK